jgi:transposase
MKLEIERLDHWGIVAGVIKDLGLSDLVNELIGTNDQEILSTGDVVAGMIINGLGFASRPLMLTPQFFEGKALELLIKPGVNSEHFNRHRIGRALDAIDEFGCEKLFNFLAVSACKTERVETRFCHADTTSYSLHGDYTQVDENGKPIEYRIDITHGYSKDKRPDLKQVIQELVTSEDGGIPLMTKTLSGNASDTVVLRERAEALREEFEKSGSRCLVADCKLYAADTAPTLNSLNFITRVPSTIKRESKCIDKALSQENSWCKISDDYRYQEFYVDQFNIKNQRWVVVFSSHAHERTEKVLAKELNKEKERIEKEVAMIQKKLFGCQTDAVKELTTLAKKWRYHTVSEHTCTTEKNYQGRGRPTATTPFELAYQIKVTYSFNKEVFDHVLDQRSCFVLATNVAQELLSAPEVLKAYKRQDYTEKGFAFLKKPEFFTSSLNLEKPGRIEAILTIMVLSLLVYSLAQRRLRLKLEEQEQTVPNQLKKPTKKPTMRWIFQLFEGLNFVKIDLDGIQKAFIDGLNSIRLQIVTLLGGHILKIYQTSWTKG